MVVISATEFRANNAKYFDLARSGERVLVNSRSRGQFELKPVKEHQPRKHEPMVVTPELQALIDQADEDFRNGKCIECETAEDAIEYFRSL